MIEISKMNSDDLDSIKDNLNIDFDDFWSYNILKQEILKSDSIYVVAKEENIVVGFAGIWISPDDVQIMNIVVKKNERKKGIGTLLLDKIINEAINSKKEEIFLEVNENNVFAINLYKKFEFEEIGRRKKYYNGTDTAIIMKKILKK